MPVESQVESIILTDENLEHLVSIVENELQSASCKLKDRLDMIDAEIRDVSARLFKLYDALETGKLDLNDLAPRIKELKTRQDELRKSRVHVEAEMVARNVEQVDLERVKANAQDLKRLLEESELSERKAFLRSFIKRIEVNKSEVRIHYRLPVPPHGTPEGSIGLYLLITLVETRYQ